jgi:hypothetical protein
VADRPAVRTVPNVELMEVGTWPASTGPVTWTVDDLAAAVAAFDDSGYTRPVVKIGHVDPRFDGQPALGRIANPRLSDDRQVLLGDLVGLPTWLADLVDGTEAYPSRSIEGTFNLETPTGTRHRFALTAVSLLGVATPAVSTLADVARMYGLDPVEVAASTPTTPVEEPMPGRGQVEVDASVSLDQVRQSFYTSGAMDTIGPYSWVREVYSDAVIVDDDNGNLFRLPWSEGDGRSVVFDAAGKQRVGVDYVDLPTDAEHTAASTGAGRALTTARLTATAASAAGPVPAPGRELTTTPRTPAASTPAGSTTTGREAGVPFSLNDEQAALLRRRLGLAEDATDEQVTAALAEDPAPSGEGADTQGRPAGRVPDGAVILDSEQYAELQAAASSGQKAWQRLAQSDRDQVLEGAVKAGKFPRARITHWQTLWDKDPDGTRETVQAMAANVVPVALAGYTGTADEADIDAEFASIDPPQEA